MTQAVHPQSLLFLTADLDGSTALKQRTGTDWMTTFLDFYWQFPEDLAAATAEHGQDVPFRFWKAIGDELIFTCPVADESEVTTAVEVWLAAMLRHEAGPLAKAKLRLKGAAFVATFPSPDRRAAVPRRPRADQGRRRPRQLNDAALAEQNLADYHYDFLGPSIDTGFRLAHEASVRRFTMSVEVAWSMWHTWDRAGRPADHIASGIDLLGMYKLKGIWNNRSYPVFAIDRRRHDEVNRAIFEAAGPRVDLTRVGEVCLACLRQENWPSRLYLPGSTIEMFRQAPPVVPDTDDSSGLGA